jgi:hypothetical protein
MLEPNKPTTTPSHPILVIAMAWLMVFTAVLAAHWVWA